MQNKAEEIAETVLNEKNAPPAFTILSHAYLELLNAMSQCPACGEKFVTLVNDWNLKEVAELKSENADFRTALEFYGNKDKWNFGNNDDFCNVMEFDYNVINDKDGDYFVSGKLARAVLSKHDKKEAK